MRPTKPYLSIVVPVFEEEDSLIELIARLESTISKLAVTYEIVLVDDGSKDRSLELMKKLQETKKSVLVIELARNFGQTAGLAAGIDAARGDVIVTMDGDLQHAPEDIPRFLIELDKGFDIVSGWRQTRTDHLLLRRLPSLFANRLMGFLSGVRIRDFGSTFKAYRAAAIKNLDLFGELHRFIPVLAHQAGARITEIPIAVHPRVAGASKYGLGRTLGVFQDIVFLEFYSNYLTKPLRAFGKLALIFCSAGFLIASTLMLLWAVRYVNAVIDHAAMLLFSVFLMIIGVQFFVVGVLAEFLLRIYLKSFNKKIYNVRNTFPPRDSCVE